MTVQLGLFDRQTVVVAFRGTPQETRIRLRTQGRERRIVRMDVLPGGNKDGDAPVPETCSTRPCS